MSFAALALLITTTNPATAQDTPWPAATDAPALEPGVTLRIYDISAEMDRLYPIQPDQTPNIDVKIDTVDLHEGDFHGFTEQFLVEVTGYLLIPEDGIYGFGTTSDDGARLSIDGREVTFDDGLHGMRRSTADVPLAAGLHEVRLDMFENLGGEGLRLDWRPPGADRFTLVPADAFRTEAGVTRVVAPGPKILLDPLGPRRPGDRLPLEAVHPGFTLEAVRPEGFEPKIGGMAFLDNGMLALTTFTPRNALNFVHSYDAKLLILENATGDPADVIVHEVCDDLHAPLGALAVDGVLYVADSDAVFAFTDTNNDGIPETKTRFAHDWTFDNFHHFTAGLVEQDGYLFGTLSTSIGSASPIIEDHIVAINGPNPPNRGTVFRVSLETGEVDYVAGGFRTPNGIGPGPNNTILVSDNQGAWKPANRLDVVLPEHFYGYYGDTATRTETYPDGGAHSLYSDRPPTPATVWLPQNEVSNSPTNTLVIHDGPFQDQVVLGEFTAGGLRRIALEQVNGVWQGVVFRFCQGFEVGVQRVIQGPDGCWYIGGTGSGGNWNWRDTQFGLQRLRPTPGFGDAFEYHNITANHDGFTVSFTQPVDPDWLADPANYNLEMFRYEATPHYGGPKLDRTALTVAHATPSDDGTSARLVIPALEEGFVVYFHLNPTSLAGDPIWSTEAWYTLNERPAEPGQ